MRFGTSFLLLSSVLLLLSTVSCSLDPAETDIESCGTQSTYSEIDSGSATLVSQSPSFLAQSINTSGVKINKIMLVAQTSGLTSLTVNFLKSTQYIDYYEVFASYTFTSGLTTSSVAPAWFDLPEPLDIPAGSYLIEFAANAAMTIRAGPTAGRSRVRFGHLVNNGNGYFRDGSSSTSLSFGYATTADDCTE